MNLDGREQGDVMVVSLPWSASGGLDRASAGMLVFPGNVFDLVVVFLEVGVPSGSFVG